jgi:hypothetical protein
MILSVLSSADESEGSSEPNTPNIPSGSVVGYTGQNYSYATATIDPDGDQVQYRFDWGDESLSEWTTWLDSGTLVTLTHVWITPGMYSIKAQARDTQNQTSSWSPPLNITVELDRSDSEEQRYGTDENDFEDYPLDSDADRIPDPYDSDDDNDGLEDFREQTLGSNPKNGADVVSINISGKTHYLIDTNGDGVSDKFYNSTGRITTVWFTDDGNYLIDVDGDTTWDYLYDPIQRSVTVIQKKQSNDFLWLLLIIGVVGAVLLTIGILYKTGYIWIEKEYINEE